MPMLDGVHVPVNGSYVPGRYPLSDHDLPMTDMGRRRALDGRPARPDKLASLAERLSTRAAVAQ